jgi:eukaryotic-like serine/threonine-protein kinase
MIGKQIGPYEVTAALGRGGMGEVYRARDRRLNRDVALKILPPEFAQDGERLARFDREARLLAALQHQNIAAIYGLEELDGQPVLVMELAEGEDLSVRLGGGALPADEILKIARQLAAGLEYAHDQGIIHRDLKPANIKLGPGGRIKILDFGLARALVGPTGSSSSANTTTVLAGDSALRTANLTGLGAVLGTAAYMSPEQTRGYAVDRRADIWAFGVILFEMLTGERLFAGETTSDTLAAVLRKDPDWDQVPADAPPLLVQICRRCLERDPQLRLRDIGEARIALEGSSSSLMSAQAEFTAAVAPAAASPTRRLPLVLAGVLGGAVLLLGALVLTGSLRSAAEPPALVHTTVVLEPGQGLHLNPGNPGAPVISPDGRHLAFSGQDTSGTVMLMVRSLASDRIRVIPGTSGAAYPFWAPDSRRLGFFAGSHLQTVDIGGGPVVRIASADNGKGGSWHPSDRILYTPSHAAAIFVVDAAGGTPEAVTDAEEEKFRSHRFPHWLPDGRHFLYLAWFHAGGTQGGSEAILRVASLDGTVHKDLLPSQTSASFAAGHLLYLFENNLMARPFSTAKLAFTGPPQPLLGGVLTLNAAHVGVFSLTEAGVLAFVRHGSFFSDARLAWVEGSERVPLIERAGSLLGIAIAPDGQRLAMSRVDEQLGSFDIWVHDIERDLATRLSFAPESEMAPIWSPDGRWIAYRAEQGGRFQLVRQLSDGSSRPEVLLESDFVMNPQSFSPDGRTLAFGKLDKDGRFSIELLDLSAGGEPQLFREVVYGMNEAAFSPDGRWLAFASDETGQQEVFVESVATGGGRWRISARGGFTPAWSPQGDRLYYLNPSGAIQATEIVSTANGIAIGRTESITNGVVQGLFATYAVDPATGRLLVQVPAQESLANRIELINGWQGLFARQGG